MNQVDGRAVLRPRVAVALGGGGARGYAHIGILEVLRERGYDVVSIAGSSMGAVIGGLFAAGGLDTYADWVRGLTHRDVLRLYDPSPRAPGAIRAGEDLRPGGRHPGRRPHRGPADPVHRGAPPTSRPATSTGSQDGPVNAAIRASAALPGFITPVVIDGRLLADGGLTNPLPIAPTVAAGADLTVAVVVSGRHRSAVPTPRRGGSEHARRPPPSIGPRLAALRGSAGRLDGRAGGSAARLAAAGPRPARRDGPVAGGRARPSVLRHTLAACPPERADHDPAVVRAGPLDFHKAEEMIALGRRPRASTPSDRLAGAASAAGEAGGEVGLDLVQARPAPGSSSRARGRSPPGPRGCRSRR